VAYSQNAFIPALFCNPFKEVMTTWKEDGQALWEQQKSAFCFCLLQHLISV